MRSSIAISAASAFSDSIDPRRAVAAAAAAGFRRAKSFFSLLERPEETRLALLRSDGIDLDVEEPGVDLLHARIGRPGLLQLPALRSERLPSVRDAAMLGGLDLLGLELEMEDGGLAGAGPRDG